VVGLVWGGWPAVTAWARPAAALVGTADEPIEISFDVFRDGPDGRPGAFRGRVRARDAEDRMIG
jgi:hypothetical protein